MSPLGYQKMHEGGDQLWTALEAHDITTRRVRKLMHPALSNVRIMSEAHLHNIMGTSGYLTRSLPPSVWVVKLDSVMQICCPVFAAHI